MPLFNMAPYYVSALVNLFGCATSVSGISRLASVAPHADESTVFTSCTIRFLDDVLCSLTLRWGDMPSAEVSVLQVLGTEGVLSLPNPDTFLPSAYWRKHGDSTWQEVQGASRHGDQELNLRGIGVLDLAQSIREGRRPRAAADVALHVVEIIETLSLPDRVTAGVGGQLQSTCSKPSVWSL